MDGPTLDYIFCILSKDFITGEKQALDLLFKAIKQDPANGVGLFTVQSYKVFKQALETGERIPIYLMDATPFAFIIDLGLYDIVRNKFDPRFANLIRTIDGDEHLDLIIHMYTYIFYALTCYGFIDKIEFLAMLSIAFPQTEFSYEILDGLLFYNYLVRSEFYITDKSIKYFYIKNYQNVKKLTKYYDCPCYKLIKPYDAIVKMEFKSEDEVQDFIYARNNANKDNIQKIDSYYLKMHDEKHWEEVHNSSFKYFLKGFSFNEYQKMMEQMKKGHFN